MPHCWHYPSYVSNYCSCLQELLPSSCVCRRKRQWLWTQRVELTRAWWQGRRKLYANYKGKRSKSTKPQNRCHLPVRCPKPPFPPAEQAQSPGIKGEQEPIGGGIRARWARTNCPQQSWETLGSPSTAHTAMGVTSAEPLCPTQVRAFSWMHFHECIFINAPRLQVQSLLSVTLAGKDQAVLPARP